jgi:hypothetical protein
MQPRVQVLEIFFQPLVSPPAEKRRIAPESAAVGVGGAGEKRG